VSAITLQCIGAKAGDERRPSRMAGREGAAGAAMAGGSVTSCTQGSAIGAVAEALVAAAGAIAVGIVMGNRARGTW
jgi:hypothetical protein